MLRLYSSAMANVVAHRTTIKVIFIVAAVAVMVLGLATTAAADWEDGGP